MWFASPDHFETLGQSEGFMARFGWCAAADHLKSIEVLRSTIHCHTRKGCEDVGKPIGYQQITCGGAPMSRELLRPKACQKTASGRDRDPG